LRKYFQLGGYVILIVLMALMFCLLPLWIWIWVAWICVMPVMFIEDAGLIAAMGRSWRLVQGSWWRTFLILILLVVLNVVVSAALGAFMTLAQFLSQIIFSTVAIAWIFQSVGIVISSLVDPIFQIAIVLIYFDLRVRREGLDLFQLAQRLAAPQPTA
jgi:Membrane domain of glycerophosphoryl diester phosphodiesterase